MKKTVEQYMAMGFERPYAEYFAAGRRKIVSVMPCEDYSLTITFDNGEMRSLSMKDEMDKGVFCRIAEYKDFARVCVRDQRVCWDIDPNVDSSVVWNNQIDLCPDMCYVESIPVNGGCAPVQ